MCVYIYIKKKAICEPRSQHDNTPTSRANLNIKDSVALTVLSPRNKTRTPQLSEHTRLIMGQQISLQQNLLQALLITLFHGSCADVTRVKTLNRIKCNESMKCNENCIHQWQ